MKTLGKLLCKLLTYWFTSKAERETELSKCLQCFESKNVEKTRQNFQQKRPKFLKKKRKNFSAKKTLVNH